MSNNVKPQHLLSLLQTDFTTIQVRFNADDMPGDIALGAARTNRGSGVTTMPEPKLYTYKIRGKVAPGDTVVVESPFSGLTCVTVVSVDETPRLDLTASFTYKWVVQRVDKTEYLANLDKEEAFTLQIEGAQREMQRHALLTQYAQAFPEGTPARAAFDEAVRTMNPAVADQMKAAALPSIDAAG